MLTIQQTAIPGGKFRGDCGKTDTAFPACKRLL
jgi:hypothetical protein